jgi:ABC-type phosphate transport system auxiliary subunit
MATDKIPQNASKIQTLRAKLSKAVNNLGGSLEQVRTNVTKLLNSARLSEDLNNNLANALMELDNSYQQLKYNLENFHTDDKDKT